MKRILLFTIILTIARTDIIKPESGSHLNYSQILFEWEQMPGVELYNLKVNNDNNFLSTIINITTEKLSYIETISHNPINSDIYLMQVCDANNPTNCGSLQNFYISDPIDLGGLNVTNYSGDCHEGLTIFGNLSPAFSAAVDCNGNQVWNSGGIDSYIYYNSTKYGDLFGGKFYNDRQPGIDFNIDLSIDFEEPDSIIIGAQGSPIVNFIQHEILRTSNGYLFTNCWFLI